MLVAFAVIREDWTFCSMYILYTYIPPPGLHLPLDIIIDGEKYSQSRPDFMRG